MKLSILLATTIDRRDLFAKLYAEFEKQIRENCLKEEVELVVEEDAKQMSIGAKRQKLLERAKGEWIVFFDSDDFPMEYYVEEIYKLIIRPTTEETEWTSQNIDCIGINILMTTNNNNLQRCCHSLKYPTWQGDGKTKIDGWDYVRNITHFNPVKRELALQTGFKPMRFGEDKDYSDRLFPLLKKEYYIPYPLFHYRYSDKIEPNIKYGYKRSALFH